MSFGNLINDLKQLGSLLSTISIVVGLVMTAMPGVEPVQRYGGIAATLIGSALLAIHKVTDAKVAATKPPGGVMGA